MKRLSHAAKTQPFSNIKAVIFDMDGLLLDTERLFMNAYQMAANEFGVDFPDKVYQLMIGHRADASQAILRENIGAEAPVDEIIDTARRYYYTFIERNGVPLRPGVHETLDYLDNLEIPMAVATSTHRELAMTKLHAVHLINRFTAIVSGDEVSRGKPAPDIYLEASRLLVVDPKECLVLEDSPAGLKAANAAGMYVVHIPDLLESNEETRANSNVSYPSLTEFLKDFQLATNQS